MLNDLLPVHNPQYNPLATPPPDDNVLADIHRPPPHGDHSTAPARPRLTLSFLDDLRLLNPQQEPPQHPSSTDPDANLAYDPQQQLSGIPPNSNTSAAAPFRYGRAYEPSSSAPSGGGNTSVYEHSTSASAFSAPSANATSATSVSGYPSSPPPSRHRSDNGRDQEFHSGTNRYTSQSPVESPVAQHATGISDSHNLTYGSANSQSQSQPQAHESYSAQQINTGLSQRPSSHYSHSQTSLSSHSQSDRFPSVSSMLSTDRYPSRLDTKYTFPAPLPERRMSEPSSHPYGSSRQYPPQAVQLNSTYSAPQPSYSLHRVNRSDSYPDIASGSGMNAGADWHDDEREKHVLNRDGRPTTGNIDPYSPIASTFSSSTSSLATGSLPSPHTAQGAHGYGSAAAGGYSLYPSPEDIYNDGRPTSSSGDSSSPSYPYGSLPNSQSATSHPAYGDQSSKTYSFVSLPGNTVRKRPRRRYDEIERLYACNFPGCTKAYGTLNHLNAHVNMQKHGAKRHPNEFKEMRKQWRKMKKEQEAEREARRQTEVMAGGHMQDLMRRRRATEPNLYGLSAVGNDGLSNGMVSSQGNISSVNTVHDQIDLQGIDTSSYGLPMNVGMDSMNSVSSMGNTSSSMGLNGGYGHHHYAQTPAYHSHGQQRTPVGVSPLSPVSPTSPSVPYGRVSSSGSIVAPLNSTSAAAASGAYYDSIPHSQQGHEAQSHGHAQAAHRQGGSSPPPINRLPPDSTLLTPLHSQSSHMNMNSQGYPSSGLPSLSSIARMDHHTHNPQ